MDLRLTNGSAYEDMKKLILIPLVCLAAYACAPKPENAVKGTKLYESTDWKMNDAIVEAQRTLPEFIKRLPNLDPGDAQVKWAAPVPMGKEHIWVDHLTYKDGWFEGELVDEPNHIEGKKKGDNVRFAVADASDWIIFKPDGTYEGGYTQKVMEESEVKGGM